jgi:hypothetical protein
VHRFDVDERYAYISTEMAGYVGNILVIYDLRDRPGPKRSPAGGCRAVRGWRREAALAGSAQSPAPRAALRRSAVGRLLARRPSCHRHLRHSRAAHGGRIQLPPALPEPSHTFMPVPGDVGGRSIAVAIDEEDHAHSAAEMERRRGRPHACLWVLDVTN